jgi:hypothetical protein
MGYYIQSVGMSMKYFLIIWVCSFGSPINCGPAMVQNQTYDNWKACAIAAHIESTKVLQEMGSDSVNQYKLGTRYTCRLAPDGV